MITALATGAFLGLSCGLAPGPLLALLLAQTLRHGPREGCKIALTPLVADAPIILVALAATGFMKPLSGGCAPGDAIHLCGCFMISIIFCNAACCVVSVT
jgi:hypothetical protein